MTMRIYVDFNSMAMDEQGRVQIGRVGRENAKPKDGHLLELLQPGMPVTLYDEELEVDAIVELVEFRDDYQAWVGTPDWSTQRDLALLAAAPDRQQ